jgi:hypothetical protein
MKVRTAGELRELLEGVPDDTPVRVGYQPNYPLYSEGASVAYLDPEALEDPDLEPAFYVGAGFSAEYMDRTAAEELWQ